MCHNISKEDRPNFKLGGSTDSAGADHPRTDPRSGATEMKRIQVVVKGLV